MKTKNNPKLKESSTHSVWNLMYVFGNPSINSKITACASNPFNRTQAMEEYTQLCKHNPTWRIWVEHHRTGKRIIQSRAEKDYQNSLKTS